MDRHPLRRLQYPYDMIAALLEHVDPKCSECKCPATREVVYDGPLTMSGLGRPPFCDRHGSIQPNTRYKDLDTARLVRACEEYLRTTEQKT